MERSDNVVAAQSARAPLRHVALVTPRASAHVFGLRPQTQLLDTAAASSFLENRRATDQLTLVIRALVFAVLATAFATAHAAPEETYDLVVYGGTSAGVMAAVQAKRLGLSVAIVSADRHLGGLSSSGLGFTDTGDKSVIGGLAREFYHRVWQHYEADTAWRWQARSQYGDRGQGAPAVDGERRTRWIFEPHVAEEIFEAFVREAGIPVWRDEWLDRAHGVSKDGAHIVSIRTLQGRTFAARVFIDASYEGDLMAAAGTACRVGREAVAEYGEAHAGVQTGVFHHRHRFGGVVPAAIDPYRRPGDVDSGLLPGISAQPPGAVGAGDARIQAYCFRLCLTDDPRNRAAIRKPRGYRARDYELLARIYVAGWDETFDKFDPVPNRKTDANNHGPFGFDFIGANYAYPEASYAERRRIVRDHERYQRGWLYFIAHDPRVPAATRQRMQQWGLAKDEFTDNGHWPYQIYVREARRLVGEFVMTEHELLRQRPTPEPVGMGSYTIDSHNVQRYVTPAGAVENEGDIGIATPGPYGVALGALLPRRDQVDNLVVPVCLSSSHVAYGSIRMEPVFMILGQSAATVAALAIQGNSAVQEVPYSALRERLLRDGQVLDAPSPVAGTEAAAGTAPVEAAPVRQ